MAVMSESTFLSSDGRTQLYYREYRPDGEAVGIVQIVHGVIEHIARYDEFASFLAQNGYIVVGLDLLGHGRSISDAGSLGFFSESDGWNKVVQDIHTLYGATTARYPGKPYYLFGHSMGSFLVRTYLIRFASGMDGAVISGTGQVAPLLVSIEKDLSAAIIRRHGATYKSKLLYDLVFGHYCDKLGSVRTRSDWLTRDAAVVDQYIADPLCGFIPSAELFYEMMGGIQFISSQKNVNRMRRDLPVLFISGDCDPVGEQGKGVIRVYKSFLKAGLTDLTMKLYHGGRHEMLNELNKAEVYQDVLSWLNGKTGR